MLTPQQWIVLAASLGPGILIIGILASLRWWRGLRKERVPVADKLLRPPGESLRLELEKLDDQVGEKLMMLLFGPSVVAGIILTAKPLPPTTGHVAVLAITAIGALALLTVHIVKLIRLVDRRRRYRLGFAGERAVGEELNRLMSDGCRVFHDVPMEPYGNIDHVVVAPAGVYAVETKVRSKRPAPPGRRDHEVIFDGQTLLFPHTSDSRPLEQTRHQAKRLGKLLSDALGEAVAVRGILTYPGWFVTNRARTEIRVLNPKNIRSVILDDRLPRLPAQYLDRVCFQLDQRCRDVAF